MGLLGLSFVCLVGWGGHVSAQAPTAAPVITVSAAKSPVAQADKAADKPAKDKPTIATPGKPAKNTQSSAKTAAYKPVEICRTIEQAAAENHLPVNFFARVIWQESRFNARLVGRKGAKGIAQFMPETADFRGLTDPFDPISSIENAARYLADLRKMFGNLGLAAAGYNAGPGRVREWLDRKEALPKETRAYVAITTGWTADEWVSPSLPKAAETTIPQGFPCGNIARLVLAPGLAAACYSGRAREWLDRERALVTISLKQVSPRTLMKAPHYPSWCHGLNHPNLSVCGSVHAGGGE
jgi:hypothetical protein